MFIALTCLILSQQSSPEVYAGRSPYVLDPVPHVAASLSMFVLVGLADAMVVPSLGGGPDCPLIAGQDVCDRGKLWGFDRSVVGNRSPPWRIVSDIGMGLGVALPLGAAFLESHQAPHIWYEALRDGAVALESITAATFLSTTLKFAVRRPRPGYYVAGRQTVAGQLSFPSGHTASTVAGLTALCSSFALRHPDSPWRYTVYGGAATLAAVTAYGRVASGWHFYSDVIGGAVLGGIVGYIIPILYKRDDLQLSVLSQRDAHGLAVSIRI